MPVELATKSGAKSVAAEELADFVMSFVQQADVLRQEFRYTWLESLGNWLVKPYADTNWTARTDKPFYTRRDLVMLNGAILKDPESHQVVASLLAKAMLSIFGPPDYVRAKPVGLEDVQAADTVSRLTKYFFRLYGHYRTMYEWLQDALIFGTGLIECYWRYEEREGTKTFVERPYGMPIVSSEQGIFPSYDDPCAKSIDIFDFYPDAGAPRLSEMTGACKRFRMTAGEAVRLAERGEFDLQAVKRAISNKASSEKEQRGTDDWRLGYDRALPMVHQREFLPLVGFEFWGETPFREPATPGRRMVLTLLEGELARRRMWPLQSARLPFFDVTINPISGRFYGFSPLEIMRYHQDFADALMMNIADAVTRSVHAAPIVDRNADAQLDKLKRWRPDTPVLTNKMDAIQFLPYHPPINEGFQWFQYLKKSIREGTGALPSVQGMGLGIDRASATEAAKTFAMAMDRPEMMATLIERDALPPLSKFVLELYQQYLGSDEDGLARRIGEKPGHVPLETIHGDYDIEFVGSRLAGSKMQDLQMMERTAAVVGATPFASLFPWNEFLAEWLNKAELPGLAAAVANPMNVVRQVMLQRMLSGGGQPANGNGTVPSLPPAGMGPAQLGGAPVE